MKSLIFASLFILSLNAFAQAEESYGISGVRWEASPSEIAKLEREGNAEVISVRAPLEGESESEYTKYLYATAGLDIMLMPIGVFLGLGVQDPHGVVAAEGQLRFNMLGILSGDQGTRNNAMGVGLKASVFPFRILQATKQFEGIYYARGFERYSEIEGKGTSYMSSADTHEIGFEMGEVAQIGLATGTANFKYHDGRESQTDLYLLKISIKLQAPRR